MLKIFCYQVIKIKQLSLSPASLCFNIAYGKNGLFSQRIRLRHLHTFVAVAQQGTLGRAAETLNLSQPALSKTLNELEQLTGARLLTGVGWGAAYHRGRTVPYACR